MDDGVKISQMPQLNQLDSSTVLAGVSGGSNYKVPASLLKGQKGDTGPKGEDGEKGAKGDPGVSPTVKVTQEAGSVKIAVTDASGTTTTDIDVPTAADLEKLEDLPGIKSIGANLTLDPATGELSATGGEGGSAKLYSTYGENTDGALTQKFASEKLQAAESNISDLETRVQDLEDEPATAKLYDDYGTNTDGALTQNFASEKLQALEAKDSSLKGEIDAATARIGTSEGQISSLDGRTDALEGNVTNLLDYAGATVQVDTKVSDDKTSTVTLVKTTAAINNIASTSDTNVALPVASATEAGVLNPATYQAIQDNADKVNAILGGSVAIGGLSESPSQDDLTSKWKQATGKDTLINGAKILDIDNNKTWTYYTNTTAWYPQDNVAPTIQLDNFTNEQAGIIKGADVDGKVYAETDGTGSVKGWDTVKGDISTIQSELSGLDAKYDAKYGTLSEQQQLRADVEDNKGEIAALDYDKQDKLVGEGEGQNIKTINGQTLLGEGDIQLDTEKAPLYTAYGDNENGALTQKFASEKMQALEGRAAALEQKDTEFESAQQQMSSDITDLQGKDTTIEGRLDVVEPKVESLEGTTDTLQSDVADLKGYSGTTVQLDTKLGDDLTSTVTIVKTTAALNNSSDTTDTNIPLPVANGTQSGIMNPSTYNAIQSNAESIDSILGGAVAITGIASTADDAALTAAWKQATSQDDVLNGAKILDVDNDKTWTYYTNTSKWYSVDNTKPEINISQFTNEAAGIIKGSEADGKIFAEADGTGSVVGWDQLRGKVGSLGSNVDSLNTKTEHLPDMYMINIDNANTKADATSFKAQFTVQSNTGANGNVSFTIPAAGTTAGLLTAADKSSYDSAVSAIGDITTILESI